MDIRPALLVVDDDPNILQLVADILENVYTVELASDVLEAANRLQQSEIDLLIIDLQMPVVGGVELIELLRTAPPFHAIPILAMSAYPTLLARVAGHPNLHVLPKPFSVNDLKHTVAEMLGR